MVSKIKEIVSSHKIIFGIAVMAVLRGSYYGYKKMTDTSQEVRYLFVAMKKRNCGRALLILLR